MHGTQFIADLMPKTPIYIAMLPDSARAVMGVPHPSGRAAMKMLEREGFRYDGYIDIFDGGPTMSAFTDQVRSVREAKELTLSDISDDMDTEPLMIAAGKLRDFVACYGQVGLNGDGSGTLDSASAELLRVKPGDNFLAIGR
jgi:arginine N-succinyltransferase